jgi:streptogramin lyase
MKKSFFGDLFRMRKEDAIPFVLICCALFIVTSSITAYAWSNTRTLIQENHIIPSSSRQIPPEESQSLHRTQISKTRRIPTQFNPWGIAIDQAKGFVWVAEPGCEMQPICTFKDTTGVLGQYAQADGNLITEYALPKGYSNPLFVAVAPDHRVWFTQPNTDAIGIFDPLTWSWRKIDVRKGSAPYHLIFDNKGNLWFTEITGNSIGFIDTKTLKYRSTLIPSLNSSPYGLTKDNKGNIWFVESSKGLHQIGMFKPTSSGNIQIHEYKIEGFEPHMISADRHGNLWYTLGFAGAIGKFTPADGTSKVIRVTTCALDACTHVSGIAVDSKGNIWFTDSQARQVGYHSPTSGNNFSMTLGTSDVHPHDGLVIDNYDTVWITEQYGRALVMIPGGKFPKT